MATSGHEGMDLIQTSKCGICGKKCVNKVYLVLSRSTSVYPVSTIPPTLHTHSRICQRSYLTLALKYVIKLLNPLNAELNPICYLLALLAHHFLHVSRIRVKSLTLRLLMSYIYVYIYIYIYIWSAYS